MKIGKKLMISNILINSIAMIMLAMIITNVVSNYIEDGIKKDLIKENKILARWLSNDKFLKVKNNELSIDLKHYEQIEKLPIVSAIFSNDDNPKMLTVSPNGVRKYLNNEEIEYILNQNLKEEYNIIIKEKSFLAYNNNVKINFKGKNYSLLVITLLPNSQIKSISGQIVEVLIFSIIIISILLIVVTSYNGRKITRPIEILKETTEKIADKNFDEKAEIKTGDELESLAIAINNMAESLRKHDMEQKKFYENISHELKTPLTVISGYAQGIKTNIFEDNEKGLDTIIEESNQLKKQLENIIYLSKLDSVNEFYHYEKTSMNDLIINALHKLDSIIILNEIDIIFEPSDDIILYVDKEKISRMIINVLSNCLKYTNDTVKIKTEATKEWIKIVISDNGKGFSQEILQNPFSRTIVGKKEGSGIGLSIIKKIIDGHSGKITLANQQNGGAIYIIEIPIELNI